MAVLARKEEAEWAQLETNIENEYKCGFMILINENTIIPFDI